MRQDVHGKDLRFRVAAWIDQEVYFQKELVASIVDIREVSTEREVKDLSRFFQKEGYRVTVDDLSKEPS